VESQTFPPMMEGWLRGYQSGQHECIVHRLRALMPLLRSEQLKNKETNRVEFVVDKQRIKLLDQVPIVAIRPLCTSSGGMSSSAVIAQMNSRALQAEFFRSVGLTVGKGSVVVRPNSPSRLPSGGNDQNAAGSREVVRLCLCKATGRGQSGRMGSRRPACPGPRNSWDGRRPRVEKFHTSKLRIVRLCNSGNVPKGERGPPGDECGCGRCYRHETITGNWTKKDKVIKSTFCVQIRLGYVHPRHTQPARESSITKYLTSDDIGSIGERK
jgi:hypothetical protein